MGEADPSFVGRRRELVALGRALATSRVVTLLGPGGIGKTRLAAEAASCGAFGVLGAVDLVGSDPDTDLGPVALAACGVREDPGRPAPARLAARVGDAAVVLVLDGCERVRPRVGDLLAELLPRCPNLQVLATSRLPLGVDGEATVPLEGLSEHEAVRLFLERMSWRASVAAAWQAARLADGLPLAVELAAARPTELPDDGPGPAATTAVTTPGPARHRSLEACVAWSTDLAGEAGRSALGALAVIRGRFTRSAALAAIGPPDDGESVLADLVTASLLGHGPEDDRYVVPAAVREHALRLVPDVRDVTERLVGWVRALAASARGPVEAADGAVLARLDRERDAVLTVVDLAVRAASRAELLPSVAHAVVDLTFWWSLRGRCREGLSCATRVGAAFAAADLPVPGALRWSQAFLAVYAGDLDDGVATAAAVAADEAAPARARARARALVLVGIAQLFADPQAAERTLTEAAALAGAGGDEWARVEALQTRACSHLHRGRPREAVADADAAATGLEERGHDQLLAWDAAIRADAAAQCGELDLAVRHGTRGRHLGTGVGEPVSATASLLALVRARCRQGGAATLGGLRVLVGVLSDHEAFLAEHPGLAAGEATALGRKVVAVWSGVGPGDEGGLLTPPDLAPRAADAGLPVVAAEVALLDATGHVVRGDLSEACAAADDADRWASLVGHRETRWGVVLLRAVVARHRSGAGPGPGDAEVTAAVRTVLAEAARAGFALVVADALDVAAGLALDAGRPVDAARLQAGAGRTRDSLGAVVPPLLQRPRRDDAERITDVLGVQAHAEATVEGERLDDPVAYALRAAGARGRPRSGWESLTPAERHVVGLVARGLTNPAIAASLLVGVGTVRTHLRSIFAKLGMSTRAELAAHAARRGV